MSIVTNWEGVGIGGHGYLIYDPLSFSRMGTIFLLPIFSGVGNGTVTYVPFTRKFDGLVFCFTTVYILDIWKSGL